MRRGRGDQFGFSQVLPLTRWMMTAKSPMGCLLALALLGLFRQRLPFRRRRCGGGSWKRGGGVKRCAATSSTACSPVTVAAAAAAAAHSACCHRPHRGQHPSVRRRRAAPLPLLPMFTARLPPLPLWPPLLPPLRGPPLSPSLHFVSCPRTSGRRVGGCCGRWWRFLARFWPMIAHALCSAPSFSSRHPLFSIKWSSSVRCAHLLRGAADVATVTAAPVKTAMRAAGGSACGTTRPLAYVLVAIRAAVVCERGCVSFLVCQCPVWRAAASAARTAPFVLARSVG